MIRHILWGIVAASVLVPAASPVIGQLEGRLWPVAGPARIERILYVEDGWTYFEMSAPKHRECSWRNTMMFLGQRGNPSVPAPFEHLDRPEIRGIGDLFWPLSRVLLTPDQLVGNSYANVEHDCGWPFWSTQTPFYN